MPIILTVLAAIAGVAYYIIRARNAANVASEVLDVANDVRLAARRFGFRRNATRHPVEDIEDANVACAVTTLSFIQLDGPATQSDLRQLHYSLEKNLELEPKAVEELLVLARWLIDQCHGPQPALARSVRKLYKIAGQDAGATMFAVLDGLQLSESERQIEARVDIKNALHMR